ncbi:magnesium transporter CorA family protein [Candidatus Trichorickettsia mobilis]|uniref:magnesium transporter CorA family protein n=1 Tax=Candidatus Trichorickettsia mobilis TaxID=1346319 RepID=UPI00292E94A6|nr:magnesium transporter CorA family protein [Candidatus Trichorickettsia mobilis]
MIITYLNQDNALKKSENYVLDESTIWIDLFNISDDEERLVESFLGIDVPTLEEVKQIEVSRRLYVENEALYITTVQLTVAESDIPTTHSVTFILHKHRLITVRYTELKVFSVFANKLGKQLINCYYTADDIFLELLRSVVERLADILESIREEIDLCSKKIFAKNMPNEKVEYREILERIGCSGDLLSKSRESLVSLMRAVHHVLQSSDFCCDEQKMICLQTIFTDINSLSDFAHFLSGELNFILDATLGMIAIEQNDIIRIFSIVAVLFLPPTLIASIYGMNFDFMPELKYHYGYPIAILLMLLSIFLTYKFFKNKKWM